MSVFVPTTTTICLYALGVILPKMAPYFHGEKAEKKKTMDFPDWSKDGWVADTKMVCYCCAFHFSSVCVLIAPSSYIMYANLCSKLILVFFFGSRMRGVKTSLMAHTGFHVVISSVSLFGLGWWPVAR